MPEQIIPPYNAEQSRLLGNWLDRMGALRTIKNDYNIRYICECCGSNNINRKEPPVGSQSGILFKIQSVKNSSEEIKKIHPKKGVIIPDKDYEVVLYWNED